MKHFNLAFAALLVCTPAIAAQAPDTSFVTGPNFQQTPPSKVFVTPTGGTQQTLPDALSPQGLNLTGANASGANVTPGGSVASAALSAIAAQQGVLLDTFRVAGDADDTASMTRAVAADVPILLGPKTYTINDYASTTAARFILRGIPGKSIIQRTSAATSAFFQIKATTVVLDGVTFDANSGSVSANQWGVLINQGGQTVTVRHSIFKNNSGTLGACFALLSTGPSAGGSFLFEGNEVTNCSANSAFFGSVSNGTIANNYVHDIAGVGINVSSNSTASGTNYAADIVLTGNRVFRSSITGINVGGLASPFTFGTPAAVRINVIGNTLQDNTTYGISLEGDNLSAIGNHIDQSSSAVTVLGAIDTLARYSTVQNNIVNFANTSSAIDIGGSQQMIVSGNHVTMNQGSAYNTGGNSGSVITGNVANLTGTAFGLTNYNVEGTGGGGIFPTLSSGTVIENNTFNMSGASTTGIALYDNAGNGLGAVANVVRGNKFFGSNPNQDITWKGTRSSVVIDKNLHGGSTFSFIDPTGSGDIVFDLVAFGNTIQGSSGSTDIRAIETRDTSTYNAGGSVLWVTPTAVGANYTAATVIAFTGTGCSGQAATPLINSGQIIGVKMTNVGTSCSGAVTAAATDSGGGSGATFSVGTVPQMPNGATIQYISNATRVLKGGGGAVSLIPTTPMQLIANNYPVTLQVVFASTSWQVVNYNYPSIAIGSLPACDATHSGATVNVSGSVSGAWQARCNGTNWIAPSGSTIS